MVDGHAQGLKGAPGRVAGGTEAGSLAHHLGELSGSSNWAGLYDSPGNFAGLGFLAVAKQH